MAHTTVAHSFVNDNTTKYDDDEKGNDKIAIVVMGTTGVGKSSLINLFCGDNVIIGHGVKSQTKQAILFQDKTNPNRYWLDSQGTNDSNGIDDEKVLKNIYKKLYDAKITRVKIIWCIDSGDFCRAGADIRIQAQFINAFSKECVWESCLIIKKKGESAMSTGLDGVIYSANMYGADIKYGDKRLFGFTYLNQINMNDKKQIDKTLKVIMSITDENSQKRHEALRAGGYLSNELIKQEINSRLSKLSTSSLGFKNQKCTKCGCKGDERYIYEPCHVAPEKYHPLNTHQYHPGHVVRQHTRSSVYEEQRSTNYNDSYHPGRIRGDRWSCCGGLKKSAAHRGWHFFTGEMSSFGCEYREYVSYSCWRYPCCGSTSSSGCTGIYTCCNGNESSTGCTRKYGCCEQGAEHTGCKTRCCNVKCYKEWGTGPGCMKSN